MGISKQQLNIAIHLEVEVANQTNSFKRAISELKNITHTQKLFIAESDLGEIRKMIDKLESLNQFVIDTKTTTIETVLTDETYA